MSTDTKGQIVINDYNKPFQFGDSNLRLISADDVVFKIHTWKLKAASSVFQAMFEAENKDDKIELTDKTLESAKILSMFLKILYGMRLEEPSTLDELREGHGILLQLVLKYDASAAKEYLRACFRLWATSEKFSSHQYFLFASQMDDYSMAAASLRHALACPGFWTGTKENMTPGEALQAEGLKGERTANLAGWPFDSFRKLSHEFIFGFFRAREIVSGPQKPEVDYKQVGAEFDKIMKDLTLEEGD